MARSIIGRHRRAPRERETIVCVCVEICTGRIRISGLDRVSSSIGQGDTVPRCSNDCKNDMGGKKRIRFGYERVGEFRFVTKGTVRYEYLVLA